jgi:CBS domain containing-hemolysin-like protein|tara:strand:- start:113 stop:424 length:312 start_codon:yes stop_codon:yes gene_type:complete
MDKIRNEKITKQVERWDLFARLTPTLFLATSLILVLFDVVPLDYAFYIGLTGFAVTAVSWWWWAIFTIRYLITILSRASTNLLEVNDEMTVVKKELQDLKDEQ